MRNTVAAVVLVVLARTAAPVAAEPLTFGAITLHHAAGVAALDASPTLMLGPDSWVGLLTFLPEVHDLDTILRVIAPLGTQVWTYPSTTDAVMVGFALPVRYTPTWYTLGLSLETPEGFVLCQTTGRFAASHPVPEPATLLLVGGALGLVAVRRRRAQ